MVYDVLTTLFEIFRIMNDITNLLIHLGVARDLAIRYGNAYPEFFKKYAINTPKRISAFFANVLHECNNFKILSENLNYSAQRLAQVWPNRYAVKGTRNPNTKALALHRNPKAIANHCYALRMGNGPESSGDGWKYRGRGPIQTTGKDNYTVLQKRTGIPCVANPDLLLEPKYAAWSSCDYWAMRGINAYADKGDFDGTCDVINIGRKTTKLGDAHGYTHRLQLYRKSMAWFVSHPKFTLVGPMSEPMDEEEIFSLDDSTSDQIEEPKLKEEGIVLYNDGTEQLDDGEVFEL